MPLAYPHLSGRAPDVVIRPRPGCLSRDDARDLRVLRDVLAFLASERGEPDHDGYRTQLARNVRAMKERIERVGR